MTFRHEPVASAAFSGDNAVIIAPTTTIPQQAAPSRPSNVTEKPTTRRAKKRFMTFHHEPVSRIISLLWISRALSSIDDNDPAGGLVKTAKSDREANHSVCK
jgi:hypothetical protein